jgi:hypothetical protein
VFLPEFRRLNAGWNAEPNSPDPSVTVTEAITRLSFVLNSQIYDFAEDKKGALIFARCTRWRLGATNDEGWYRGQCRYSRSAPIWGEFYELAGEDDVRLQPDDWHVLSSETGEDRHFLFYLRDETFECFASDWTFEREDSSAEATS